MKGKKRVISVLGNPKIHIKTFFFKVTKLVKIVIKKYVTN